MSTECTAGTLEFQAVAGRTVQARFDGGALTSDGGAVLLREVDRAKGILRHDPLFAVLAEAARLSAPLAGMRTLTPKRPLACPAFNSS